MVSIGVETRSCPMLAPILEHHNSQSQSHRGITQWPEVEPYRVIPKSGRPSACSFIGCEYIGSWLVDVSAEVSIDGAPTRSNSSQKQQTQNIIILV